MLFKSLKIIWKRNAYLIKPFNNLNNFPKVDTFGASIGVYGKYIHKGLDLLWLTFIPNFIHLSKYLFILDELDTNPIFL